MAIKTNQIWLGTFKTVDADCHNFFETIIGIIKYFYLFKTIAIIVIVFQDYVLFLKLAINQDMILTEVNHILEGSFRTLPISKHMLHNCQTPS